MIVDKGTDFPHTMDAALKAYGESMWFFREQPGTVTTRALNTYSGDHREYVQGGYPARNLLIAFISYACPCILPQAFNTLPPGYVYHLVT